MTLTNELPNLTEGSSALSGRFVMINFPTSFYGGEDHDLMSKLEGELPAILNWALAGYDTLRKRGRFVQPNSAQELLDQIEMLGAPVKAFVRDCCIVGPGQTATAEALYEAWKNWCTDEGRDPETKSWFCRNLNLSEPGLRIRHPRAQDDKGSTRLVTYEGLGLRALVDVRAKEEAKRVERTRVNNARTF
jgi:putative DNA primase/helicase